MNFQIVRDPITGLYSQIPIEEAPKSDPLVLEEWEEEVEEVKPQPKPLKPVVKRVMK